MQIEAVHYELWHYDKEETTKITCYQLITLSPISETNINVNAAVNPDFARAATSAEGPPLKETISENNNVHPRRIPAIDSR